MKVVLDTNVLVSAFATRGLCAELMEVVLAEHQLLTSEIVITELRRALQQKFKVPVATITAVDSLLREQVLVPQPSRPHSLWLRDPDDCWILASAVEGKADLLVTGDKDMLDVALKAPIRIVTPRECWHYLKQKKRS